MALSTMAESIKFALPSGAQYFTPFRFLPVEVRYQIWETAIFEPGMHFLKLVPDSPFDMDILRREAEEAGEPKAPLPSHLEPLYPSPKANPSSYVQLNERLSEMRSTCEESNRVVDRLLRHRGTLTLGDGRAVLLGLGPPDVVCLEYLPPHLYHQGCDFFTDMACPTLELVRHVALRYHRDWEIDKPTCTDCSESHDLDSGKNYPLHIHSFLKRHFPRLETVYFIDYLLLKKEGIRAANTQESSSSTQEDSTKEITGSPNQDRPAVSPSVITFKTQGRTYTEVRPDSEGWLITSGVFDTIAWVQEKYVKQFHPPKQSNSKKAINQLNDIIIQRQQGRDPTRVQFKVLACEWDVAPASAPPARRILSSKKGMNKRVFTDEASGRALKTSKSRRFQAVNPPAILPPIPAVFVFGEGEKFDFSFCQEREVKASGSLFSF